MEKLKLVIADDVEMNRTVIKKLMGRDFDVMEAENGIEVLEILEHTHVDVIILDIVMPEMDGIETLRNIRKHPQWNVIGVLVATSKKEQTERMALSEGADDVVAKPYDPIIIKQRIGNILAKKEMDKMQMDDIKGITGAERREVDHRLFAMQEKCKLAKEHAEQPELEEKIVAQIEEDVQFLIHLLTTKEGY